jgi:holliday junction DNA helicase RuvA
MLWPWPSATPTRLRSRRLWHEAAPVIAFVRGEVITRLPGEVVIEASGVGYRLAVSSETLADFPAAGREGRLFAHLVLRDDGMQLYGFSTQA